MSRRFRPARHHDSWHHIEQMRELRGPRGPLPQVALAGRSNAGKSSLVNTLLGPDMAYVSRTPGKTRALEVFISAAHAVFVDLPGYGYAARSREERQQWQPLIDQYLHASRYLQALVIITDGRHPPFAMDIAMAEWALTQGVPTIILLNKWDATNQATRDATRKAWETLGIAAHIQLLPFSCRTGLGLEVLEEMLWQMLSAPLK